MKIATWNVNGVRARAAEVLDFVAKEAPDVLCLQEIKSERANVPEALRELPGYWSYWHGHKGYSGVALLLRRETFPLRPLFSHPSFDHETRIVTARLGAWLIASTYVPNGGKSLEAKVQFLEGLGAFSAQAASLGERLFICGDLNVARHEVDVHPALRRADQIGTTPHERDLLEKIIAPGLVDVLREARPDDDRLFTWWAPWRNQRQKNVGWRIDYVLAPEGFKRLSCESQRWFGSSDHGPVVAVIDAEVPRYEGAPEPPDEPAQPPEPGPGQIPLL